MGCCLRRFLQQQQLFQLERLHQLKRLLHLQWLLQIRPRENLILN
jgi:hypothetical protein